MSVPLGLGAQSTGRVIGFVYDEDGTTPLPGAVVELRNLSNHRHISSLPTDEFGIFRLENVERGVYVYGVTTDQGSFNADGFVAIKIAANETAKMAISLKPYGRKETEAVSAMSKDLEIAGETLVGAIVDFNSATLTADIEITRGRLKVNDRIHARGRTTNFYQDLKVLNKAGSPAAKALAGDKATIRFNQEVEKGDLVYVVKKKEFNPLFLAPIGLAAVIAGSSAIQTDIKVEEHIIPVSAFRH
jgi:hypothetical protein